MEPEPERPQVLQSWKEIAHYLGVSVRTAQLWEQDRGLPVQRMPGHRSGVRATVDELELWKSGDPAKEQQLPDSHDPGRGFSWRISWRIGAIVGLAIVAISVTAAITFRAPELASVRLTDDGLSGLDSKGAPIWHKHFGVINRGAFEAGESNIWMGDLDGDTSKDVLFIPTTLGVKTGPIPLLRLNSDGTERWRFDPGRKVSHKGFVYEAPFVARQFAVLPNQRIVVTSHHSVYTPAQIAVLDARNGSVLREYWHRGHLNVLAMGTFGQRAAILAGGVNHERQTATAVVLDPDSLEGCQVENGLPQFDNMKPGKELARVSFPRSSLPISQPYNSVARFVAESSGGFRVEVMERINENPVTYHYHLGPNLDLKRLIFSDLFGQEFTRYYHVPEVTGAEIQRLSKLTYVGAGAAVER